MDASYAEVGTEVVIAFHRSELYRYYGQRYVCRKATITRKHATVDSCQVDADPDGSWWPIEDMILASDIDLLMPEQRARIR